jgi:hypothetical protein
VTFPDEGAGPYEVDLSAEYGDSTLCEETLRVLK